MKIHAQIGKDEYIIAGQLLSDDKQTLMKKRITNIFIAIISFISACILMKYKRNKICPIILFGITAFFILLAFWNKSRWASTQIRSEIAVRAMHVDYDFQPTGLTCYSVQQNINLRWNTLQQWGTIEHWLYLIFENKQIVVIDQIQQTTSDLQKIEEIIRSNTDCEICRDGRRKPQ